MTEFQLSLLKEFNKSVSNVASSMGTVAASFDIDLSEFDDVLKNLAFIIAFMRDKVTGLESGVKH